MQQLNKYLGMLSLLLMIPSLSAEVLDLDPATLLEQAKAAGLAPLTPIETLSPKNENLYLWGKDLFFDKNLSGNKNISCASCHGLDHYSGDGLPLAVGEGATFSPSFQLASGHILKRHTPNLINLGRPEIRHYFWDGRVAKSATSNTLFTPESELTGGANAKRQDILAALSGPLAAQALFPLADSLEMAGQEGENPIANLKTRPKRWDYITENRVLTRKEYVDYFKKSFPQENGKMNIGHVATALAEFQTHFFASSQTAYDQFMSGNLKALNEKELRGLSVFINEGQCASCHNGEHLSNFEFDSSGAPQIGLEENLNDLGRREVTRKGRHSFMFKTTALRNVALTAPYFHSGSIATLEGVVDHYNAILTNLNNYVLNEELYDLYEGKLLYDSDPKRNDLRKLQVEGNPFQVGLKLTSAQKDDLVYFLKHSLTDSDFKKRIDKLRERPSQ
jgi:cytochrome c peroxidase